MKRIADAAIVGTVAVAGLLAIGGLVLVLAGFSGGGGRSAASVSTRPPRALLASIVAAALSQKSVHWTESEVDDAAGGITRVVNANADSGVELERFTFLDSRGSVAIRLVDHTAYVRGDAAGLWNSLSLTPARAKRYAGQWVSVPQGDKLYSQLTRDLTLASIVHGATSIGPVKVVRSNPFGMLELKGESDSRFYDLSARATGRPLPVDFSNGTRPVAVSLSGSFDNWNERVHVRPPATSTPIATVRGG
jgi:hypothetical protein